MDDAAHITALPSAGDLHALDLGAHGRCHFLIVDVNEMVPWTDGRIVVGVTPCTPELWIGSILEVVIQGGPVPMIGATDCVVDVYADRLGTVIGRDVVAAGWIRDRQWDGTVPPDAALAGSMIVSRDDPRLHGRRRAMYQVACAASDAPDLMERCDRYLDAHPDYRGPGVICV